MKFLLSLVLFALLSLAACKTTSNQRILYSPEKPHGPWTDKIRDLTLAGRDNHRSNGPLDLNPKKEEAHSPAAPATPAPALPAL